MQRRQRVQKSPTRIDELVGARVRMHRMLAGMSQGKLGEAIGVTFQQVQKYENGKNRISASRLHQIAAVLGVAVSAFYEGSPSAEDASADRPASPRKAGVEHLLGEQ
jgi:transcriptional regulator with XRE-family HTH domain